jgi:hypothetical protein
MPFSSYCSEIPDATFLFFSFLLTLGNVPGLPAIKLNKLVWPLPIASSQMLIKMAAQPAQFSIVKGTLFLGCSLYPRSGRAGSLSSNSSYPVKKCDLDRDTM